jgi:hypothetical protein
MLANKLGYLGGVVLGIITVFVLIVLVLSMHGMERVLPAFGLLLVVARISALELPSRHDFNWWPWEYCTRQGTALGAVLGICLFVLLLFFFH